MIFGDYWQYLVILDDFVPGFLLSLNTAIYCSFFVCSEILLTFLIFFFVQGHLKKIRKVVFKKEFVWETMGQILATPMPV